MSKKFTLFFTTFLTILFFSPSFCKNIECPEKAKKFIPLIRETVEDYWPTLCPIEVIPGQIERESNWNVKAERKVGREYGFGLSQVTIVKGYFDNFRAFKEKWKKELEGWTWKNRFEPIYHIKIVVLYDHSIYQKLSFIKNYWDRIAFTLSAYNGGLGLLLKERRLAKIRGLDPNLWFENVEKVSARAKWSYKVNRVYVRKILLKLAPKYKSCFSKTSSLESINSGG
jgi:hypothetical protein